MSTPSYARHRFPPAIIQHAVRLYFRFALSYRDVEDLLAERGIDASYETLPDVAALEAASQGVAFAAIGLLLVICLRGVQRATRFPSGLVVIAVTATCVGLLRWPLIPVVLVIAPLSVALAWRRV